MNFHEEIFIFLVRSFTGSWIYAKQKGEVFTLGGENRFVTLDLIQRHPCLY